MAAKTNVPEGGAIETQIQKDAVEEVGLPQMLGVQERQLIWRIGMLGQLHKLWQKVKLANFIA